MDEERPGAGGDHAGHADHGDHGDHGERDDHSAHADHGDRPGHGAHIDHAGHEAMFRRRFWVCLGLTVPVLLYSPMLQEWFSFSMPAFPGSGWIGPIFALVVFGYGGVPFLRMASAEVKSGAPGMMTLISLAITVALAYSVAALFVPGAGSFFWELVTLIDVMLLGHWIEMRSVRQASGALDELAALLPETAERVGEDGGVEHVALDDLRDGDIVLIRPGASVPADGEVIEGETQIDESMLTGESKAVSKAPGDGVVGGTINGGGGSLRVRVTATGEASALAGIMRLVDEAQRSRSRAQLLADRAAGWLFYIAIGVALITAAAWSAFAGFGFETVERVATVLVIACPHALGLAVPLVVSITTGLAARNGILVRDRLDLEAARGIDVVLFDKTGTLTKAEHGVVDLAVTGGMSMSEDEALALAAAVEGDSEHPVARALGAAAAERDLELPRVTGFENLAGRGVRAQVGDRSVHVGGPRMLEHLDQSLPDDLAGFADRAGASGSSVVHLIVDGTPTAAFALADVIRPESHEAVAGLIAMGVEVAMLTGDSEAVANAVARTLGIERVFAEVLPEHKVDAVKALQAEGRSVAMVGDGVNDAPALVQADVGIAIGGGTDVAIESAGVILVNSDPLDVVKVIGLSRASYRKMVQNLVWATGYNVVALPLAAGVLAPIGILLSPAVGALFMSLSTVIVAVNAQLLRRVELVA